MTFTKEQLEILKPYEEYFRTAVKSSWARHPGRSNLRTIYDVFIQATGDRRRFDDNCQHCILTLLTDCGVRYFQDVESLAKTVQVKEEDIPVKKVRAKVKTTRK